MFYHLRLGKACENGSVSQSQSQEFIWGTGSLTTNSQLDTRCLEGKADTSIS